MLPKRRTQTTKLLLFCGVHRFLVDVFFCCVGPRVGAGQKSAGTLPSDFEPAESAVSKLTFGVSGRAANTDEGAEPFLAGAHP